MMSESLNQIAYLVVGRRNSFLNYVKPSLNLFLTQIFYFIFNLDGHEK